GLPAKERLAQGRRGRRYRHRRIRASDVVSPAARYRNREGCHCVTAGAGGFVAASYVTLTFYDFFSLRTIGRRDVPYRVAAMAIFISYTIGHNLGATVFTAGAIRFRIYSAWGLSITDVVKIAFVTGLMFWLGNRFM